MPELRGIPSTYFLIVDRIVSLAFDHRRMARGRHGLPKVSLGHAMAVLGVAHPQGWGSMRSSFMLLDTPRYKTMLLVIYLFEFVSHSKFVCFRINLIF
jgi:hypothetical protein